MKKIARQLLIKFRRYPVQSLVLFYFVLTIFAAVFFYLPITQKEGMSISFLDALFTAASAVSTTGLTVVTVHETFNLFGLLGLLFFMQVGGMGIMAMSTLIWMMSKKRIGIRERKLIMLDHNRMDLSRTVYSIRTVLQILIAVEVIGTIILGFSFIPYFSNMLESFKHALFISVSATTNTGFDLTGGSLVNFANNYFVQLITILLIFFGSIGFPVLIEVKEFFLSKQKKKYRFSLYTKLTTWTFFALVIFGTIMILLFEKNGAFVNMPWHEAFFSALFQSVTTRNAGITTIDITLLSRASLLIMGFLMFVGASPSSAGGGIRTTTFALNLLTIHRFARGNREVRLFKRQVREEDLNRATVVTTMAILICAVSVLLLAHLEPFSLEEIIFEVMSAFGTTGLSLGITRDLSQIGRMIIVILMFIGRIGVIATLYTIGGKHEKSRQNYHYPEEQIIIG